VSGKALSLALMIPSAAPSISGSLLKGKPPRGARWGLGTAMATPQNTQ
jgi:hypothetical protein